MVPTLCEGDEVLVDTRAYRDAPPQVGDVVWAQHPLRVDVKLVKRITAVTQNQYFLNSDNPDRSFGQKDSHDFGTVLSEAILGRVCCRFFN